MIGATSRQMALLRFIHGYQLAHGGVSPALSECAQAIGVRHKSTIFRLLTSLEKRGHIRRLRFKERAIEVLRPPAIPMIAGEPLYAVPLPQPSAGGKD